MADKRSSEQPWKPTKAQLQAAVNNRVRDVIAENLDVLFVGINPGLYSAAIRHHFGYPGNRFWPALNAGGFTPDDVTLSAFEERRLLDYGLGITNLCPRPTARADELSKEELQRGARTLLRKVRRFRPQIVAFLGITSYRTAFDRKGGSVGRQSETFGGAMVWILPNPSGLNAHFQIPELSRLFGELRRAAKQVKVARKK